MAGRGLRSKPGVPLQGGTPDGSEEAMSSTIEVVRRTFEASKHPKGSEERARLNRDARTSEYMPSYRYMTSDGKSHRTKALAQLHVELTEQYAGS